MFVTGGISSHISSHIFVNTFLCTILREWLNVYCISRRHSGTTPCDGFAHWLWVSAHWKQKDFCHNLRVAIRRYDSQYGTTHVGLFTFDDLDLWWPFHAYLCLKLSRDHAEYFFKKTFSSTAIVKAKHSKVIHIMSWLLSKFTEKVTFTAILIHEKQGCQLVYINSHFEQMSCTSTFKK